MHLSRAPAIHNIQERLSNFMKLPWVSELLEWTFLYDQQSKIDQLPYNTTFFQKIGKCTYEQWKSGEVSKDILLKRTIASFNSLIYILREILEDLWKNEENITKTTLEKEWIEYMIIWIETGKAAIPIELEKASHQSILWDDERKELTKQVEQGQSRLYGPKISENLEEVLGSFELLCTEYNNGNQYLTDSQKVRFTKIYTSLVEKIRWIYEWKNIVFPKLNTPQKIIPIKHKFTVAALEKSENIYLPKVVYMKLFQQYIDAQGLRQRVVVNPDTSSIYDSPDELQIPNWAQYEVKNIKEILLLMVHEIGVHYTNQATSEKNWFQVRWAKNVEKEEWLAIIMESLFAGTKLKDITKVGYSYPYALAWEFLSKDDRQTLVDLRIRMDEKVKWKSWDTNHQRDLRVMRWYPLDGPWAQRKDLSYGSWARKIIHLVQEWKCSILDLYKWKFWIDDIVSGRLDILIPQEKVTFPLLFPEMLLFLIWTGRDNFTHTNFVSYLREKYAGDIDEKDLNNIKIIQKFSKIKILISMWRKLEAYL